MSSETPASSVMDLIVSLCKRRGFVYQASEIYGGIRGFWDYGPLGVLLKNNIRDHWWKSMVECPPVGPDGDIVSMVGLDSSIIQHPTTWKASGHVDTFTDPMVDDKTTQHRFRADKIWVCGIWNETDFAKVQDLILHAAALKSRTDSLADQLPNLPMGKVEDLSEDQELLTNTIQGIRPTLFRAVEADGAAQAEEQAEKLLSKGLMKKIGKVAYKKAIELTQLPESWPRLSPETQEESLTEVRKFNLMLDTYPGPIRDEQNKAYLRPETAQGIFLNFKNIVDTNRIKVPFGVAQVGKSFRNEVTPRNFIFRSREFEQMEMEFFCPPDDALKWYEFWRGERMKWWLTLGIKPENLKFRDHATDELSHYSKATVDIEYKYPFTAPDFGELEGIAHRGDYDLTQHAKFSGQRLDYFDQELQLKMKEQGASAEDIKAKSRYVPNVIEPASGLTRAVLVLLCEAYTHEKGRAGAEEYFKFKPKFAPVKLGVFPLVNKDGMPELAEKIYMDLRQSFTCEYDPKQSIGKRYARMDEIGTPMSLCIDGDSLKDNTVTVRDRDTMQQQRVSIDQLKTFVADRLRD